MEKIPPTTPPNNPTRSTHLRTTHPQHHPTSKHRRNHLRAYLRSSLHALHQRSHHRVSHTKQTSLQTTPRRVPTSKRIHTNYQEQQHLHLQQQSPRTPRNHNREDNKKTSNTHRTQTTNHTHTQETTTHWTNVAEALKDTKKLLSHMSRNFVKSVRKKLENYHKKQIHFTKHAEVRLKQRNITKQEVIEDLQHPKRLDIARKQRKKPQDKGPRYDCYFGKSKNLCHRYVLIFEKQLLVIIVIKIQRRWQRAAQRRLQ